MFQDRKPRCNLIGQTFFRLKVLDWHGHNGKGKHFWICSCDCGKEVVITTNKLKNGNTKSCGCYRSEVSSKKTYTGFEQLNGTLWGNIKKQAALRGMLFEITIEYAWDLFLKQNRKCALSDLPISFLARRKGNGTASLDRIDSNEGYVDGNVQWVHKDINWMKNTFSQQHFVDMCKKVADHAMQH